MTSTTKATVRSVPFPSLEWGCAPTRYREVVLTVSKQRTLF
jgi:hypothetical protein